MKPLEALESAINHGLLPGGQYPSEGLKAYLRRGTKDIPEKMLPGGIIKCARADVREALSQLTSRAVADVPDWVVKQYVG